MFRLITLTTACLITLTVTAQDKPEAWQSGTVNELKLRNETPGVITDPMVFERLYKKWMPDAKLPEIDFTKNLVLVATTRGSEVNGKPTLTDGDLKFNPIASADLRDGFRFLFVVYPKEGVTKVNGKELTKK